MTEQISSDVSNKLFTPSDDFRDYVGIGDHLEAIMDSLLCLESGGVRMVGIVGPSGIGKTTIARALYRRLCSQFDHHAMVSYKRTFKDDYSMKLSWVEQFLSEILGQKDLKIESLGVVEQRLKFRKVLIVLDEVDAIELLEALVGQTGWFGFGSRIIVVTQDRALLKLHEIDLIYEVEFPFEELALQMFCQSAFRQNSPPDGFLKLAVEIANLAGNLPLGLNVLGSSLRGKDKEHWVEMMPRLQNGLNGKIERTLRVSYDGLDEKDDQNIFVYIACLFNGESVKYIKILLENGLSTSVNTSLRMLADKSLLRITAPTETVQMHILLQKLGREIVRAESINNPGKRRFLVNANEISDLFNDNTGTENVLGLRLNTSKINEPLCIDEKSFEGMCNLQFIKFYKKRWEFKPDKIRFNLPRGLVYLPRKLRLLHWDDYPAKCLPCSFRAEYVVELIMRNSKLEKLWEKTQPLRSLKKIDLSESRYLKEIPDLSNATNLETLSLHGCTSLVTLPSSIGNLKKLRELWMSRCLRLEELPTDINLESLGYLGLTGCSKLKRFPRISKNISYLSLDGTAMEVADCFWIENLSGLTFLEWKNCPLRCMPSNFHPEHLLHLKLTYSKLEKLWTGVKSLKNLGVMDLSECKNLKEIPDLSEAAGITELILSGCKNLKELPDLSKATNLVELNLARFENLKEIPSSIQNLHELRTLDMRGCTSLEVLPTNINLASLSSLDLSGCSRLTIFPQLSTSINKLRLDRTAIEEVPSWIENITGLTLLCMSGCKKLRKISATIWNLIHLEYASFSDCGGITSVSDASQVKTIERLHAGNLDRVILQFIQVSEFESVVLRGIQVHAYLTVLFVNCLNLDQAALKFILQSDFKYVILPGIQVPMYFTYRTRGSSLTIPLLQSSLSQNNLRFTACIIPDPVTYASRFTPMKIIVHWKLRGVTGVVRINASKYYAVPDHMVVFHFDVCPREEVDDPPTQLDCNSMEFEFELSTIKGQYVKKCGVRDLNVPPSLDANDRSSGIECTGESGESDVETGGSKKCLRMTVKTSQEHCNPSAGQTLALNSDLSLGLDGASSNIHGDGTSMYHSLSPSYPCLEGHVMLVNPMIMELQDTKTPIVNPSFSSRFLNFFRCWK